MVDIYIPQLLIIYLKNVRFENCIKLQLDDNDVRMYVQYKVYTPDAVAITS